MTERVNQGENQDEKRDYKKLTINTSAFLILNLKKVTVYLPYF